MVDRNVEQIKQQPGVPAAQAMLCKVDSDYWTT